MTRAALSLAAVVCGGCLGSAGGDENPPAEPDAGLQDACAPLTCADLGYSCGEADDGCGGHLDCGGCEAPLSCGDEDRVCICQFQVEVVDEVFGETEIVREPEGTVHVLYAAGDANELRHAWRAQGGAWERESVPEAGEIGSRLRAAIEEGGTLHAVFHDPARGLVYTRRSAAGEWSAEIIDGETDPSADLALDAAGGVYVSYAISGGASLASRGAADGEFSIETVSNSQYKDTAVAVDDRVHVIYQPFFGDSIRHASRALDGTEWQTEPIAEDRSEEFHLAADASGGLHLLYTVPILRLTRYAFKETDGAWENEDLGPEQDTISLAVSPSGQPHVAWSRMFGAEHLRRSDSGDWTGEPLGRRARDIDITLDERDLADIALYAPDEPAILHAAWPCPSNVGTGSGPPSARK